MGCASRGMWRELELGAEQALARDRAGARFLFGRGPRWGGVELAERATAVATALGPSVGAVRWCRQVHGRAVASVAAEPTRPLRGAACVGRCDGLVTADPNLALMVWTADCVPVLIAGGGVVAAVHAGWRGIAAGVVDGAVARLWNEYGVGAGELCVALGPAVGSCHYQVGGEVIDALDRGGGDDRSWAHGDRVDLRALLTTRLAVLGVPTEAVESVGGCTACDRSLSSYRRDGERAGRQWSLIVRTPSEGPPAGLAARS